MADITIAEVRAEYPLLTSSLRGDTTVTARIAEAKVEAQNLLRGNQYDVTDISADAQAKRAWLELTLALLLTSALGEQGWPPDVNQGASFYGNRWTAFREDILADRITLSLSRTTGAVPTVNNMDLGESAYSQVSLDGHNEYGLSLENEE